MFEHLDDGPGFAPDDDFRSRVVARGRQLRRRRSLAVAGGGALTAVVLVVGAVAAYGTWRLDQVRRVEVGSLAEPEPEVGSVTFVVVGEDVTGGRADSIAVVTLDREAATASALWVPRDLWLTDPTTGTPGRVSAIYSSGGPDALLATLREGLGVAANHFVAVDFDGFVAIADAVGPVRVAVSAPLRDLPTGLDLAAGCNELDGPTALALARSRHAESFVDGAWRADPTSDLGRIVRAQAVVAALASGAREIGLDPVGLDRLLDVVLEHVVVDAELDAGELLDLACTAMRVDPAAIAHSVVPATSQVVPGGATVLVPAEAGAGMAPTGALTVTPCD